MWIHTIRPSVIKVRKCLLLLSMRPELLLLFLLLLCEDRCEVTPPLKKPRVALGAQAASTEGSGHLAAVGNEQESHGCRGSGWRHGCRRQVVGSL